MSLRGLNSLGAATSFVTTVCSLGLVTQNTRLHHERISLKGFSVDDMCLFYIVPMLWLSP